MEQINQMIDQWQNAAIEYDNKTRTLLRRITRLFDQVECEHIDELLDNLSKPFSFLILFHPICSDDLIETSEELVTKSILKLDQELANLDDESDDEMIDINDDTNDGVLTQRE